jgi:hypothetical protein
LNHAPQRKFYVPSPDTVAPAEVAAWAGRGQGRRSREATKTRPSRTGGSPSQRPSISPADGRSNHSEAELELMQAMTDYKQSSGRMFPTWSEVLEVLQGLGYRKDA